MDKKAEDPHLWDKAEEAKALMQKQTLLRNKIEETQKLEKGLAEVKEFLSLAKETKDSALEQEGEAQLKVLYIVAQKSKWQAYFTDKLDSNDCFVEIHPGAGGTESQDWAAMLLRMYRQWAKAQEFSLEILEETAGEEAGIKSVTAKISGANVYGWLKREAGVHRLVRISPFDSAARRHTSFASVGIYPVIDDKIEIEISESDVRVDTYRARGAGGQHVNTTDSAVRLTHLPSGVAVQCQNERSQHKNRATCWNMLRARLYELEQRRRQSEKDASLAKLGDIGWGNQIRSYVLQPYQLVKDLRTQHQSGAPQKVLDGALDEFLTAALEQLSDS